MIDKIDWIVSELAADEIETTAEEVQGILDNPSGEEYSDSLVDCVFQLDEEWELD